MTLTTTLALFGAMLVFAMIPGPGVFIVVARSISSGFRHGAATVAGIVLGDYVFILISVLGLVVMADVMGRFFILLKYAGAAYLLWLAFSLWRADTRRQDISVKEPPFTSNLIAGLLTSLGNPKVILFYMGFFPAFLDLSALSTMDLFWLLLVTAVSIGSVLLSYAWAASRARHMLSSQRAQRSINRTASGIFACSGVLLATKV